MSEHFRVEAIDHVEFFVPDRYEAAQWYEATLGLTILKDYEHWATEQGPLMISSDNGATKLALFTGAPRGNRDTAGFHLVAFRVSGEGFLQFLDRLEKLELTAEQGGRLDRTMARDHGQAWSIYFRDPWGHRLELTTYDHATVAQQRG